MNSNTSHRPTNRPRALTSGMLASLLAFGLVTGCANSSQATSSAQPATPEAQSASTAFLENLPIEESDGSIDLVISIDDFNKSGFEYGDSLDISFTNGYEMQDIPYYNGYYGKVGDQVVVSYPGNSHVKIAACYGDSMWKMAGVSINDTATVRLRERGAHLDVQEAFNITYSNERDDFESDVEFANFRALTGGSIAKNVVFRSASPIDNTYLRADYVSDLAKKAGISYILNLSDSADEADENVALSTEQGVDVSLFTSLREVGKVSLLNLNASYPSEKFAKTLAQGLVHLSEHDGPYLIHCVEGKDRTGFVCMLLEALCGASYDEMLADYMATFDNYYDITTESDPSKYEAISDLNLDGMLSYLANAEDDADLRKINYEPHAREYLRRGGMTDEQIDALVARIKA